jgi:hypothetical protein
VSHGNTSEPIHVIIDVSRAAKCEWCGTQESDDWKTVHGGKMFCCRDCQLAFMHESAKNMIAAVLITGVPLMTALLIFQAPSYAISIAIFVVVMCVYNVSIYTSGASYAKRVSKNSRAQSTSAELALIRRLSAPVKCPNCHAELDLSMIESDMVYHCSHCGAAGLIEVTKTGQ